MAALKRFSGGIPLSFVIVRYFVYTIAAIAIVCAVSFAAFAMTINAGVVYPASYGAEHIDETVAELRSLPTFDPEALPSAYRYVLMDSAGTVLASDLPDKGQETALRIARSFLDGEDGDVSDGKPVVTGEGGTTYAVFTLSDSTVCVLSSTFLPQFISRELRDSLPNPQNLMLVVAGAGSIVAILLIARRASRVISRKMAPLTDAAERIAHEDLSFSVETSNVRQINDVLGAMERMRSSLKESLESRWRAEQAQRNQVAALAHDLKTPLTVVRANADYVAEETADMVRLLGVLGVVVGAGTAGGGESAPEAQATAAAAGAADALPGVEISPSTDTPTDPKILPSADELADIAAAARDASAAAARLDDHVRLLIEASRGEGAFVAVEPVAPDAFASDLEREASALARAASVELNVKRDSALSSISIEADREALGRAVMNIVSNAFDHARGRVDLSFGVEHGGGAFTVVVDDDGPGFSAEALEHGCDRFFRGDSSRTGSASGAHYGIGLFAASETIRSLGGSVELSNRVGKAGRILGAHVVVRIPAFGDAGTMDSIS